MVAGIGLVVSWHVGFSQIGGRTCLLDWQADSLPLSYQGIPDYMVFILQFVDVRLSH